MKLPLIRIDQGFFLTLLMITIAVLLISVALASPEQQSGSKETSEIGCKHNKGYFGYYEQQNECVVCE